MIYARVAREKKSMKITRIVRKFYLGEYGSPKLFFGGINFFFGGEGESGNFEVNSPQKMSG